MIPLTKIGLLNYYKPPIYMYKSNLFVYFLLVWGFLFIFATEIQTEMNENNH